MTNILNINLNWHKPIWTDLTQTNLNWFDTNQFKLIWHKLIWIDLSSFASLWEFHIFSLPFLIEFIRNTHHTQKTPRGLNYYLYFLNWILFSKKSYRSSNPRYLVGEVGEFFIPYHSNNIFTGLFKDL